MRRLTSAETSEFRDQGFLIIRNALSHRLIEDLSNLIGGAYRFVDELAAGGEQRQHAEALGIRVKECLDFGWMTFDDLRIYAKEQRRDCSALERVATELAPAATQLASAILPLSRAQAALRRYLHVSSDPRVTHLSDCSVTRRQSCKAIQPKVQWHRDYNAAFTRQGRIGLNFWVPMRRVGDALPSLELLPGSGRFLVQNGISESSFSEEQVQRLFSGQAPLLATMDAGDVLAFHYHTVHRTQPYDVLPEDRISAEFRFIAS
jgi:ectoine hydroxylase-related dioxygenase (phytanoyl-CoA dioxygenase family)